MLDKLRRDPSSWIQSFPHYKGHSAAVCKERRSPETSHLPVIPLPTFSSHQAKHIAKQSSCLGARRQHNLRLVQSGNASGGGMSAESRQQRNSLTLLLAPQTTVPPIHKNKGILLKGSCQPGYKEAGSETPSQRRQYRGVRFLR